MEGAFAFEGDLVGLVVLGVWSPLLPQFQVVGYLALLKVLELTQRHLGHVLDVADVWLEEVPALLPHHVVLRLGQGSLVEQGAAHLGCPRVNLFYTARLLRQACVDVDVVPVLNHQVLTLLEFLDPYLTFLGTMVFCLLHHLKVRVRAADWPFLQLHQWQLLMVHLVSFILMTTLGNEVAVVLFGTLKLVVAHLAVA